MATIVASRFAVLSVDDDDDDSPSKKKKSPKKKAPTAKPQNSSSAKSDVGGKKKKKQENAPRSQTNHTNKGNASGSTKKKKPATTEQWEEWKIKDNEFIEGSFEEDLSKAILLSKIEYEQKKNVTAMVDGEEMKTIKSSKKGKKASEVKDSTFLGSESKKGETLERKTEEQDSLLDEYLMRLNTSKQDLLSLISYKALIAKKDAEIIKLKEEVESLTTELKNVKTRNTKLCQIIGNAEMKDKAEVLMEVERLQTIKDELSSEVATLHIQLEQERSKCRQLNVELKSKDKSKRHHIASETQ